MQDLPKTTRIFDMMSLIARQATPQGFIQDRGVTRRGQPRLGYGAPVGLIGIQDALQNVYLDNRPNDLRQAEYAVDPTLLSHFIRQVTSHLMGRAGLTDGILQRFNDNARKIGKEVIALGGIERQIEAFIVWKAETIYDNPCEIAKRRSYEAALQTAGKDDDRVKQELRPFLVIPAAAQDLRTETGGTLVDDSEVGQVITVKAAGTATFNSSYLEGDTFDIEAGRFFVETTRHPTVHRSDNSVT